MRFTKVSQTAFDEFQLEAGLILKNFNPASPDEVTDEDIVCATTGGVQITCKPTYTDYGEDVDNVPANMLEMKEIDGWECTIGFTALTVSAASAEFGKALVPGNFCDACIMTGPTAITVAPFRFFSAKSRISI